MFATVFGAKMKLLFAFHLVIGIWLIFVGLFAAARPHILLDVVLTPDQLSDQKLHDSTLALLQRGAGSDSTWMVGIGVILAVSSLIGVTRKIPHA